MLAVTGVNVAPIEVSETERLPVEATGARTRCLASPHGVGQSDLLPPCWQRCLLPWLARHWSAATDRVT